jgi:hypothetical protein
LGIFTAKKHPQGVISVQGITLFLLPLARLFGIRHSPYARIISPRRPIASFAAALFPLYQPVK